MRIRQFLTVAAVSLLFAAPAYAQSMAPSTTAKPATSAPAKPATATPTGSQLDINSASKAELEALKGIGPVRADAIIKGRPYKGKDELHEKKIISKSLYNGIKDQIIAKQKS